VVSLKLVRFASDGSEVCVGIVLDGEVVDLGIGDPIRLIQQIESSELSEEEFVSTQYDLTRLRRVKFTELDNVHPEKPHLLKPIVPPEVWGFGVTYTRSRAARETETSAKGIYDRVYEAERPEVFFKASDHRCVGPNQPVCIREDSHWCVPEPELAVVVGVLGQVLGFTAGNDMSARDIEGENPLYLPQAKIYENCCSLGPVLVTPSSIGNVRNLSIRLSIMRGRSTAFEGATNTGTMKRTIPELLNFLTRNNPVPYGSVCLTGTGIVPPDDLSLRDGDLVEISIDNIGTLRNPVKQL
jgi:2-dehydro-3-deoxy-D-arabinonate dehydratase